MEDICKSFSIKSLDSRSLPFDFGDVTSFAPVENENTCVAFHCQNHSQVRVSLVAPQIWKVEASVDLDALARLPATASFDGGASQTRTPRQKELDAILHGLDHVKSWVDTNEHLFDEATRTKANVSIEEGSQKDGGDTIVLRSAVSPVAINVQQKPFRLSFTHVAATSEHNEDEKKRVFLSEAQEGVSWDAEGRSIMTWRYPGEEGEVQFYGLGERSVLQKGGRSWEMWNMDAFGYKKETDNLYQCYTMALVANPKRNSYHGFFFDNPSHAIWDFTDENELIVTTEYGLHPFRYYVIGGGSPTEVIQNYASLTGIMPMPPKWALGYQQCRWSYEPDERVRRLANDFREKDIPCDVIWLDIDYMDGFRCFTWDDAKFPDPEGLASFFHENGFKMVVMIDPGLKEDSEYKIYNELVDGEYYVKRADGKIYHGDVWPGSCGFPDFTRDDTRKWWGQLYHDMIHKVGVDGFWNDMNEPAIFQVLGLTMPRDNMHFAGPHLYVHNMYGMMMARGTYEGLRSLQVNKRPFLLTRSGYCGVQKYAWMWTGDNRSTWDDLRMTIPICLGMSISGVPGCGVDIGGFGLNPTPELFARWIELGAFLPLCRVHTMKDTIDQEPWSFGEVVEEISRKHIKLRYRLMPYFYTWMRQAAVDGTPLMRSLWMEFTHDPNCWLKKWEDSEFMVGPSILVAPVVHEQTTSRDVYLPATKDGRSWIDFYTHQSYKAGQVIKVEAPLDFLPLFVLSGTVLPTRKAAGINVVETDKQEMEYKVYRQDEEEKCEGRLYVDDGESCDFEKGEYALYSLDENGIHELLDGKALPC
ncbi:Glycosyl hydrolase [Balamuthia mandrillaris]